MGTSAVLDVLNTHLACPRRSDLTLRLVQHPSCQGPRYLTLARSHTRVVLSAMPVMRRSPSGGTDHSVAAGIHADPSPMDGGPGAIEVLLVLAVRASGGAQGGRGGTVSTHAPSSPWLGQPQPAPSAQPRLSLCRSCRRARQCSQGPRPHWDGSGRMTSPESPGRA